MGMHQHSLLSPNTWVMFLRKPRVKPFLSGPFLNTGALNASETKDERAE